MWIIDYIAFNKTTRRKEVMTKQKILESKKYVSDMIENYPEKGFTEVILIMLDLQLQKLERKEVK